MPTKKNKESRLRKYLKAPIQFLIRAKDFYMKSMTGYSDQLGYGAAMACPVVQADALPKSFSVNSTRSTHFDDDYRELLRAASTRNNLRNKEVSDHLQRQRTSPKPSNFNNAAANNRMPRSCSVGIGRIDEDKTFEDDDIKVKSADPAFQRSRSCAVSRRTTRVLF